MGDGENGTLIGRERELDSLLALVRQTNVRLLTLRGPGGVGKTALARAVSALTASEFADGVAVVDLSSTTDPALVATAVCVALGVAPGRREPPDALAEHLADRERLLVLDGFEHVLPASLVVAGLLERAPRVKLLVTSRVPLQLGGEREVVIGPLAPDAARKLFAVRARAARPDLDLEKFRDAIDEICERVDRLPLAIELAAARCIVLSPSAIVQRLGNRLDLLTRGSRDRPERQRTIRALIEWSCELLDEKAQCVFRRLAAFAGGCDVSAAEAVCGEPADAPFAVVDRVTDLVEASLVHTEGAGTEVRFRMLETIHDLARERLEVSGESAEIGLRHARHYLKLAERTDAHPASGPERDVDVPRMEREHDNFRLALGTLTKVDDRDSALRLATGLWRLWWLAGHYAEGRRHFEALLARGELVEDGVRARGLAAASEIARAQGDFSAAVAHNREALDLFARVGDRRGEGATLRNLALALGTASTREPEPALLAIRRCRAIFEELSDQAGVAMALNIEAEILTWAGRIGDAVPLAERGLAMRRKLGGRWAIASSAHCLGDAQLAAGEIEAAARLLREAVELFAAAGDRPRFVGALESLAALAAARGRPAIAIRLTGFARATAARIGARTPPELERLLEPHLESARRAIRPAAADREEAAGAALSFEDGLALALETAAGAPPAGLTRRELEVAILIARGLSNREIAERLVVGARTVETHVQRLLGKLDLESRTQVAVWVLEQGLLAATPSRGKQHEDSKTAASP